MAEDSYSPQLREHLEHPHNAGAMDSPDGVGVQANPICGDTMKLMLRFADGRVAEARWQTVGCEPARAVSSIATDLAIGRTAAEIEALTDQDIERAAGGLPARHEHASALASGALRRAVAAYRARGSG